MCMPLLPHSQNSELRLLSTGIIKNRCKPVGARPVRRHFRMAWSYRPDIGRCPECRRNYRRLRLDLAPIVAMKLGSNAIGWVSILGSALVDTTDLSSFCTGSGVDRLKSSLEAIVRRFFGYDHVMNMTFLETGSGN